MIDGEDIKPCFDTPESDSMWIDEYIALSESLAVGDKLSVKSKEKTIKEYTIAGIYSGENTFLRIPLSFRLIHITTVRLQITDRLTAFFMHDKQHAPI